jgi:hypothetical protein
MNARVLAVLLAIALYSSAILTLNSVVLPAAGLNGVVQLNSGSFDFLGPVNHDAASAPRPDWELGRDWGASRFFSLWLRPFGVHKPDGNDAWWAMGSFAVLGTVATGLLFLFPKRIRYVSQLLRAEPPVNHLLNVLVGVMAYFVAFALLRLSWLTIVGVPFIPFLVGGAWMVTMLSIVAISFTIGRVLLRRLDVPMPVLAEALIGLWLLFITSMLPVIGWVVGLLAAALGFGAMLQTRFGSRQRWSLDVLEEPAPEPEVMDPKILPLRRVR